MGETAHLELIGPQMQIFAQLDCNMSGMNITRKRNTIGEVVSGYSNGHERCWSKLFKCPTTSGTASGWSTAASWVLLLNLTPLEFT